MEEREKRSIGIVLQSQKENRTTSPVLSLVGDWV